MVYTTHTGQHRQLTKNYKGNNIAIFSDLRRVIDEVGKERVYALFAHHEPAEFYRTLEFRLFGSSLRFCTRCTGIFIGIIATLLLFNFYANIPSQFQLFILLFFSIPAIIDWMLYKYEIWNGTNIIRLISGLMLGINYIFLWWRLIRNPFDAIVWQIAIVYSAIVTIVIISKMKRRK